MVEKNTAQDAAETAIATPDMPPPDTAIGPGTDGPTGAVWDALRANPGASVAVIAVAAKTPEHTTRRTLAALEIGGHARRTAGRHVGGKRTPDAWYPVVTDPVDPPTDDPANTAEPGANEQDATAPPAAGTGTATDDAGATATANEPVTGPDTATGETASKAAEHGFDTEAVTDARAALARLHAVATEALDALDAGQGAAALAAGEEIYRSSGKIRRLVRAAVWGRPRCASGRAKSRPGELQAKVVAHLNAYPGKEFTPHEIAKVIGHSAGAISNALDRLVDLGEAVNTCERPRRFTAAIEETAAAPPTDEPARA